MSEIGILSLLLLAFTTGILMQHKSVWREAKNEKLARALAKRR